MVKVGAIVKDENDELDWSRSTLSLGMRGILGDGGGFGLASLANSRYGRRAGLGGIYQRRVTGYNQYGRNPKRARKTYYVKMRNYRPTNPRTPAQQAQRSKMSQSWDAWRALPPSEKEYYYEAGRKTLRRPDTIFRQWWLKNN